MRKIDGKVTPCSMKFNTKVIFMKAIPATRVRIPSELMELLAKQSKATGLSVTALVSKHLHDGLRATKEKSNEYQIQE